MKITFSLEFYNPISNCKFSLMNRKFDDFECVWHHTALYIRKFSNFSLITAINRCYSGSSFALYRSHMSTNTARQITSNRIQTHTRVRTKWGDDMLIHKNVAVSSACARARVRSGMCVHHTLYTSGSICRCVCIYVDWLAKCNFV